MRAILVVSLAACGRPSAQPAPASAPIALTPAAPAPAVDAAPAEPDAGVEYSVSAVRNVEKGRDALGRHDLAAARAYFEFVIARFPFSGHAHDAELGLLDADADEMIASGRDDIDTVVGYCGFITHHPFHPRVTSGEIACRIHTIQKTKCAPDDRTASRYCGAPGYCRDAKPGDEVARRKECK